MKTLKHLTEGMFADGIYEGSNTCGIREGMFDVDDNLDKIGDELEWEACFSALSEYNRNQILNDFKMSIDGNTLTITRINNDLNLCYFNLGCIEEYCKSHKFKKIVWKGDDICFYERDVTWNYPITFVVDGVVFGNPTETIKLNNIKIRGREIRTSGDPFKNGCEFDVNKICETHRNSTRISASKVNAKVLESDWPGFDYDMEDTMGRVKGELDQLWSRYIDDIELPNRKGKFINIEFEDMNAKKAKEFITKSIFSNSTNCSIETILVHYRGPRNKWFTIKFTDDSTEMCVGYYTADCEGNSIKYKLKNA